MTNAEATAFLQEKLAEWQDWSLTADRDSDGWEADWPGFWQLMEAATEAMLQTEPNEPLISLIAQCWRISEEDEVLCDFCRDHLDKTRSWLIALSRAEAYETRWQVAAACTARVDFFSEVLTRLAGDPHAYVRRRALLAMRDGGLVEWRSEAERMLSDADGYNRRCAAELIREANEGQL